MIKPIKTCRACGGAELTPFLDLGEQYLSDFRTNKTKTPKYPLVAVFCGDCKLVQLEHTTPQKEMYHDNYGFKSGISDSIKKDLDDIVTHAFQYKNDPKSWLDIASNDGTLLSFVPSDVYRVGVDPVKFLCEEAKQHADLIINDYFDVDAVAPKVDSKFDVITSISCFYDMPDPSKFVDDVKKSLSPRGVWVIQQNYLLATIEYGAVDNFCHEHIEYYTLLSLENLLDKHDLEVIEVYLSDVNGGSIRTLVMHKGTFVPDESVANCRKKELEAGLTKIKAYKEFAEQANLQVTRLKTLVTDLREQGNIIGILAASTRGATIWQSAGLDEKLISFAAERNPAKVGKYFTAIGVPIISEEEFRRRQPDYMLLGPWFFAPEVIAREKEYLKSGGKIIKPLPEVEIISE